MPHGLDSKGYQRSKGAREKEKGCLLSLAVAISGSLIHLQLGQIFSQISSRRLQHDGKRSPNSVRILTAIHRSTC